jgi:hypothetical protein
MTYSNIFRDKSKIDDVLDKDYIICKILQYWTVKDWELLRKKYTQDEILKTAKKYQWNLDDMTRNYLNSKFWMSLTRTYNRNELIPAKNLRF